MIPKVIHYCWFGRGEKPALAQKCIASWKKYCPDFQIVEWNEDNFDLNQHPYLKWCHEHKKWAFLSDFARLLILKEHGGVYMDTDVEVIRPLDSLMGFDAFYGFETPDKVNTGEGFGCVPHHPTIEAMARVYQEMQPDENGDFRLAACPQANTQALLTFGLIPNGQRQTVGGAEILPEDFLNPYDDPTGRLRKTNNTYSIHWYGKSWMDKKTILRSKLMKPIHRLFGKDVFKWLRKK